MNYGEILKSDIANGVGIRVTLFVSGCTHRCKGCFNEMTWDFGYGEPFTEDVERLLFEPVAPDWVAGLTILGGEPFEPSNQETLAPFLERFRAKFPAKDVWCYTGCVLEKELRAETRWRTPFTERMLKCIDVLVDGPFVESLKDISLKFRGSSNQRVLKLQDGEVRDILFT